MLPRRRQRWTMPAVPAATSGLPFSLLRRRQRRWPVATAARWGKPRGIRYRAAGTGAGLPLEPPTPTQYLPRPSAQLLFSSSEAVLLQGNLSGTDFVAATSSARWWRRRPAPPELPTLPFSQLDGLSELAPPMRLVSKLDRSSEPAMPPLAVAASSATDSAAAADLSARASVVTSAEAAQVPGSRLRPRRIRTFLRG